MAKAPAFQFYPADWQRDLSEHPLEIEGAWIRICCALWWSETPGSASKPLTNWARVLRVGEKKSLAIIEYLLNQKIAEVNIQNSTITISSRRMVKDEYIRNVRRMAGLKGGNPTLLSKDENGILLNQNLVNQNPTPSSSSSTSSSNNKKKSTSPNGDFSEEFLEFYNAYPNRIGRKPAWEVWKKLKNRPSLETLLSALEKQKRAKEHLRQTGQFVSEWPYPERWLKKERWNDEIETGGNSNGTRSGTNSSQRTTVGKTATAQSDGQPYPPDREY